MSSPRIVIAAGPRAVERLVLEHLERRGLEARRDYSLLARPLRVIVPSISLRNHLSASLVRRFGAVAGCQVVTLASLARDVLERAGEPVTAAGTALFEVLVRRLARHREALAGSLGELEGGYGVVAGAVRDLLDAGLEPAHAAALDDYLESTAPRFATPAQVDRVRSVFETSLAMILSLEQLGLAHRSTILTRARDALETHGPELLPTRDLLIHGFADATGVVTDFLETLLRAFSGTLFLDRPPWPGQRVDGAVRTPLIHGERLARRLSQVAGIEESAAATEVESPAVELVAAPDLDAEMREIALRVHCLIDAGAVPETIGLVARNLEPFAWAVRRHFRALGVPFSAVGAAGPVSGAGRELTALGELLERGGELTLERWLDVVDLEAFAPAMLGAADRHDTRENTRSDLRLAFFALGASRLDHLEQLDIEPGPGGFPLPVGDGLTEVDDFPGDWGDGADDRDRAYGRTVRRRLERDFLFAVASRGRRLAAELAEWREAGHPSFAAHRRRFLETLERHFGWAAGRPARVLAEEAIDELDIPGELDLEHEEFVLTLVPALERRCREPLGGRGGGVQVLGAMEARGRTFEHLFLAGMTRGVFPRVVRLEPLLPDRLRRDLTRLLPDLPVKAAGFDEERHLFAQLLSAAPRVVLSHHQEDGVGRSAMPSPLLEALSELPESRAPQFYAPSPRALRPVEEELAVRAVQADRAAFAELLEPALQESRRLVNGLELPYGGRAEAKRVAALAGARLAVLDELDPDRRTVAGRRRARRLGPYFGFVGSPRLPADPRRSDLYVTTLENLAACPWQTFLTRILRVEPTPDPLAALPSLRGLLVGRVVHRVLERLARTVLADSPQGSGAPMSWPPAEDLETAVAVEAAAVLGEEGLGWAALGRAAVEQARPYLEVARQVDWEGAAPRVSRVEATEVLRVDDAAGRQRLLRFRADRVDAGSDGGRRYTDYKTGSPGRRRRDDRDELHRKIAGGEWLQAAAYAARAREDEAAVGRYVFLRPDLEPSERVLALSSSNRELHRVFADTVRTLLAAWDAGTFFPRLVEPHEDLEPPRCRYCRVAEACSRRDSGARVRLRRWAEEGMAAGEAEAFEHAWRGVWELRRPPSEQGNAAENG